MTVAEKLLAWCVVGLAGFIGGQAMVPAHPASGVSPTRHEADGAIVERTGSRRVGSPPAQRTESPSPESHSEEWFVDAPLLPSDARSAIPADVALRRLAQGIDGTYMDHLLLARDSTIARWPDRTTRPLRVFIRDGDALESWNPDFVPAVRDAFDTWTQAGLPLRFTFVVDSASADVHVRFVGQFENGISGRTMWSRDANYWLVTSDIQLALSHPSGGTVTPPQMRAIALHEVGHLIGLDHAPGPDDIMSARVRVRELSESDRATARLVYALPAGSLK